MAIENGPVELGKMLRDFEDLSRGRYMKHATRPLATEVIYRIKRCFSDSTSPYKEPWAPVARGGKPLLDTARLARAFQDASQPPRIEIHNPTLYANLQNYGGFVVAKAAPYLHFAIKVQGAVVAMSRGAVTKRRRATKQWVKTKMVYIEARPFLPDDRGLPEDWAKAMELIARHVFVTKYPSLNPGPATS